MDDGLIEIITISGPSGAGKSAIIEALRTMFKEVAFSVSHTTRKHRKNEVEGTHYYFVNNDEFFKNEFYEKIEYVGKYYGTTKDEIKKIIKHGKIPILDVNIDSIPQLRKHKNLRMTPIYITAPLEELEFRLKTRTPEMQEAELAKRLAKAKEEEEQCKTMSFYDIIENIEFKKCLLQIENIVKVVVEREKTKNGSTTLQNGDCTKVTTSMNALLIKNQNSDGIKGELVEDSSEGNSSTQCSTILQNGHVKPDSVCKNIAEGISTLNIS